MELTSPAFEHEGMIPKKYTCEGENISPPLMINGVPEGAKSLVLVMYDPDIPDEFKKQKGIPGWDHWIVYNIDPSTSEIKENSVPESAVEGMNTNGNLGYTGPCPPKNIGNPKHRYFFWLYAIDIPELTDFYKSPNRETVESVISGHTVKKAELMGFYEKES